jgi:hypothetical protein
MKGQELKEMQDKSLKISMQDYMSGNIPDDDYKKMTFKEQMAYITEQMAANLNANVRLEQGSE